MAADYEQALPVYYRALELARQSDAPMLLATTACNLGGYQNDLHNPEEARPLLEEALAVSLQEGSDRLVGMLSPGLVECYVALGLPELAAEIAQRYLADERYGRYTDAVALHGTLALAWLSVGRLDDAEQALARAWSAQSGGTQSPTGVRFSSSLPAFLVSIHAAWLMARGDAAAADEFCEASLAGGTWASRLDNPSDSIRFFEAAALAAEAQGDFRRALMRERERWQVHEQMVSRGGKARVQTLHVQHELARLRTERDHARSAARRAQDEARRDALTGLNNRRHLDEVVAPALADQVTRGIPVALAVLDLDRFKAVNDVHGHAVGDRVLAAVARVLENGVRRDDHVCRLGGEEFVVVLPGASIEQAVARCEEMLAAFQALEIEVAPTQALRGLSFSCGVAHSAVHGADMTALLDAADQALYRAKQSGRARVMR